MKISIDVDVEPEELRRLLGLPDAQKFWSAIYKRIEEGDSEMALEMIKNFIGDSFKANEYLSRITDGLKFMQSKRKSSNEPEKKASSTRKKTTSRKKK